MIFAFLWAWMGPLATGQDLAEALPPGQMLTDGGHLVLEHTEVDALVQLGLAVVDVRQRFRNPFGEVIDATYVFPLPTEAAVREMRVTCGDRELVAEIAEKEAARRAFEEARAQGKRAALLEQQRANVFTQEIASLCPGETVYVSLQYVEQLTPDDSHWTFAFPTTLGPRYAPGDLQEPPFVASDRSGRDLAVRVELAEGLPIESVWSDTHGIDVVEESLDGAVVELAGRDRIPNRDFHLGWTMSGEEPRVAAVRSGEGHVAVRIEPQLLANLTEPRPRELLFVLDASCSMRGQPWQTSVELVHRALSQMRPGDTFNLVKFSGEATSLFSEPQPANLVHVAAAREWLHHFVGGGTEMSRGIVHSLTMPGNPDALRLVLLLTDGYIGNERHVFRTVSDHLSDNDRIFALGVGASVNRLLIDELAYHGRGAALYQLPDTPLDDTVADFAWRIAYPAMTDISVDFGAMPVTDVFPARIPDLFAGQSIQVVGRTDTGVDTEIIVSGRIGETWHHLRVPLAADAFSEHEAVSTLWARRFVQATERDLFLDASSKKARVLPVALEHHLVSAYTSLVATDHEPTPCGTATRRASVPSHLPEGVSPEGVGLGGGIGGLIGAKGAQVGAGGLGARGSGLGGGGMAQGLGGLGTKGIGSGRSGFGAGGGDFGARSPGGLTMVGGEPITLGALHRGFIDQVIRRHMNQIRYCYQRELQKNPTLAGKVVVGFTIAADGTVSAAEIKATTLGNEAVEQCVIGRFERMEFSEPTGGGIVIVSYPLLFEAAD